MGKKDKGKEIPTDTILIGLHRGEFGWMLMYVARARHKSRNYKNIIVACEEGMEYLYEDFATKIHAYPYKTGWRDRFYFRARRCKTPTELILNHPDAKIYAPTNSHCIKDKPEYMKYGTLGNGKHYDILIHARSIIQGDWIDRKNKGDRNYSIKRYRKIIKIFPDSLKVASIGSRKGAKHISKTDDLRGMPLRELCDVMATSKMCVGTSSFPLHLAHACGCPVIVFTGRERQKCIKTTNRKRYIKLWRMNPGKITVLDRWGWKPPVDVVAETIKRHL